MKWVLALDIGNSSVVAATATHIGSASIVPLGTGHDGKASWMPAAVFLTGDTVYTGQQAIDHASQAPSSFARSPKRYIGSDNQRAKELFTTIIEQVRRAAVAHVDTRGEEVPEQPTRLILTHPAAWPSSARKVLTEAAVAAGFSKEDVALVSEPIAASYSLPSKYRSGKLLVLDVGGGTCDVAVVDMEARPPRVLADGGENAIGGNSFDLIVMDLMEALVLDKLGELPPILHDGSGRAAFVDEAQRVREQLSHAPDATFEIDGEELLLTRSELEKGIAGDIERMRGLIDTKTQVLGVQKELLSVLLVGGTTQTPAIAAMVQEFMDVLPVSNPVPAVALGAAEYGVRALADEEAAEKSALSRGIKPKTPLAGATNTSNNKSAQPRISQKMATRIGAVVAGLTIAAGVFYFVGQPNATAPVQSDSSKVEQASAGAKRPQTYPNVNIGSLQSSLIEDDAPAFKDGYLSCEPMVFAAEQTLSTIKGFPGGSPYTSGFSGTSECRFDGNDPTATDRVVVKTNSPAGKMVVSSDAKPAGDPRISHWYEITTPRYEGATAEVIVYVQDFGWISVETNSKTLFEAHVLHDVAASLDAKLHLRRA